MHPLIYVLWFVVVLGCYLGASCLLAWLLREPAGGLTLDATHLLGFGEASQEPLPNAEPGTIVLRYGGWSLQELRDKRRDLMHAQNWYDKYPWASERLPSGIYVLRLPVPDSNCKTFDEQKSLLLPNEEPAHIVLAATALLSIRLSGGQDSLANGWTRTGQQTGVGIAVLDWDEGRLFVHIYSDGCRYDSVWLASARKAA